MNTACGSTSPTTISRMMYARDLAMLLAHRVKVSTKAQYLLSFAKGQRTPKTKNKTANDARDAPWYNEVILENNSMSRDLFRVQDLVASGNVLWVDAQIRFRRH